MIYFDTEHEAYAQKETIEKWGKTYLTECTEIEYQELQEGKLIWVDDEIVENPNYEEEQKQKERERRNQEIDEKIKELQIMALPEVLNGNIENIKLYNNVIDGLNKAKL